MIADAVREIAGDKVTLAALMGPGVDPHLYKASKGDIDNINRADLILYNGLHLEAKMADVLKKLSKSKPVVAVGDYVDSTHLRFPSGHQEVPDPHIWFNVALWRDALVGVTEALAARDTIHATEYHRRAAALVDSLTALDSWVRSRIAEIPESQRIMITAHDAFGYFGEAYGIQVRGLQGLSTVSEAGLHDVTSMVDFLVANKIKAVFVESSVPRKTIEAVVDGCAAAGHNIDIGGELFSDAMGREGTPEGTYMGMVRHNVNTIVEALR
jgi:manganese/zinc/iron transport system substrate-binding protein